MEQTTVMPHVPNATSIKLRRFALILTAILSVVFFVLALTPLETPPLPGTDKTHHLIAFAALTLPCAVLYPRALPWVVPLIILEGGLIEIVQPYVNRMREWADFVADLKGVGLGLVLGLTIHVLARWARPRLTSTRPQA